MRDKKELEDKIKSLLCVVDELVNRTNELDYLVQKSETEMELKELSLQFDTVQSQLTEIYGNIWSLRWALGEIDDVDFAMYTATSVLEKN